MSTLFISHSSRDAELAREVERRLAGHGHHSVFLDLDPEKGMVAGKSWERTLYRKLRACRAVIAVCTDHYLRSHWCFAEIALARMEGKHLFALQAEPLGESATMPSILTEKQFIDLRRGREEGFRRLRRGLEELDLLGAVGEWPPNEAPYLGLSAYQEEHAPVFFGREEESQAGIELLERGAPGWIMVLGASGSGKSSLVRAGILPRLRRRPDEWLIVDPFRPGRDPAAELAESLAQGFRQVTPGRAAEAGSREWVLERLRAGMTAASPAPVVAGLEGLEIATDAPDDERLGRLLELLERLRRDPPSEVSDRLRDYLEWSLEDLRRIYGEGVVAAGPRRAAPGTTPLVEIAHDLRRLSGRRSARVLLVVDQFEELLGRDREDDAADRFLALLRTSVEAEDSPLMVLATLRSDFLGAFQRQASLRGLDFESLSLGPMKIEGMRRVIEAPARLAAIELEQGLADRLLEDTETPDALPLLSFTLWVLWNQHRDDGKLEIAEYERLGGLHGAITGEADAVLASARRQHKEDDLRQAFLRMARLSEDGSYARSPVSWDQVEIRRVRPILEQLVERRVLVSRTEGEAPVVEVAHEALFRAWKPLRTWLDDARSELLLRQQLDRDAETWKESGRATDHLWRGGRLLQARELLGKRGADAGTGAVPEFVQASRQRQRRLRVILAATTVAVIATLAGFLVYALAQAERAREQQARAREQQARAIDLARVGLAGEWLDRDATRAALVMLEVEDPETTRFAPKRLSDVLGRAFARAEYRHAGLFPPHELDPEDFSSRPRSGPGAVRNVALSPDGSRVLTTSGNLALIWEAHSGRLLHRLEHESPAVDGSFDPNGKFVVTRSGEFADDYSSLPEGRVARVWEVETGRPRFTVAHEEELTRAAFGRAGRFLVTASRDGTAQLWDVASGELRVTLPHDAGVVDAAFSPNGKVLVTVAGKEARLWDVTTGEEKATLSHERELLAASFSRDSARLAIVEHGSAKIWDVETGEPLHEHALEHHLVKRATFSSSGRYLLTSSNRDARVWTVRAGRERGGPLKHPNLVLAAFSADDTLVITASGHPTRRGYGSQPPDNMLRYWDAESGEKVSEDELDSVHETVAVALRPRLGLAVANIATRVGRGRGQTLVEIPTAHLWNVGTRDRRLIHEWNHRGSVSSSSFSVDGRRVVVVSGAAVRSLDVATGEERWAASHEADATAASFGPEGKFVVTASKDGTARLWDAETGEERLVVKHESAVQDASLVDGGKLLRTTSARTLRLWRLDVAAFEVGDEPFELPGFAPRNNPFDLAPNGELVATRDARTVRIWDVRARAERFALQHEEYVRGILFVGASSLMTQSDDEIMRIWDLVSGEVERTFEHAGKVVDIAVSPDSRTVLTASADRTARLWDPASGEEFLRLRHECPVHQGRFIAQGRLVVTWSGDDDQNSSCNARIKVWNAATGGERSAMAGADQGSTRFSPDGKLMVTVTHLKKEGWRHAESEVRVWDVDIGEERFAEPFRSEDRVDTVAFSPDGSRLLTEAEGTARLWAVSGRLLQSTLAAATSICLRPDFRRQNLGESAAEAREKFQACELRHGREPLIPGEPEPQTVDGSGLPASTP